MESVTAIQQRTIRTLVVSQMVGGIGTSTGIAVAALVAESLGGAELSGLGQTAGVLGSAVAAVPLARLMAVRGRRIGLAAGYVVATAGAMLCILSGALGLFWPFLAGMFLVGPASAANLLARYAATDLATDRSRARSLSVAVWALTVGVVVGPNLVEPGAAAARGLALPELMGPYVFAIAAYAVATVVVTLRMRPDPLLTARAIDGRAPTREARPSTLETVRLVGRSPGARTGVVATATAYAAMVAVMSMTPVHLRHGGATLSTIGFVISLHIAGMYGLAPLFGWLSDAIGRPAVIAIGQLLMLAATAVAGTAPTHGSGQLGVGLTLLGLGWSCSLVGGSTLLSESVDLAARPAVQGVADLLMGLSAAAAAAMAGLVIAAWGYGALNGLAAALVVTAPVVATLLGSTTRGPERAGAIR